MHGEYTISGKHFHLAAIISSIEHDAWAVKDNQSKSSRMTGVLGEMFAAMHLETSAGRRSCIPQGLFQRTGLFSRNTLDRGDVILVGKRKIKSRDYVKNYQVDAVQQFEVKATSTQHLRGLVDCNCVAEYALRHVTSVLLVHVEVGAHTATGTIDEVATPTDIMEWPRVETEGRMFYQSPMVKRKLDFEVCQDLE